MFSGCERLPQASVARMRFAAIGACVVAASVLGLAGCEQAQLLAPTGATITVSAPTRVLPTGGSTQITAFVVEQGGTPVHNGTTVRFTTTLGQVDPVETQTRNGTAVTTFLAGNNSGIAEIRGCRAPQPAGRARQLPTSSRLRLARRPSTR